MGSTNHTFPVLNPNIYLNYLPPATANAFEVARDIYLVTFGALAWDVLSSLPKDLFILRNSPLNSSTIAYALCRLSALAYVLQSVIAKTHKVSDCTAIELGVTSFWVITFAFSSFLFLRRVQAVYADAPLVSWFFNVLWVANVGISVVVPIGSHSGPLANTGYCVNTGIEHYVAAATFMPLAFDSLVFLAISYRILTTHGIPGEIPTLKTLWNGKALPRISQAVLRGGQQYYLITVGANILVSVLIVAPGVPPLFQAVFTIPDLALTSVMACRVFRNLRFSASDRWETNTFTSMKFQNGTKRTTDLATSAGMHTSAPSSDRRAPSTSAFESSEGFQSDMAFAQPIELDLEQGKTDDISLREVKFSGGE